MSSVRGTLSALFVTLITVLSFLPVAGAQGAFAGGGGRKMGPVYELLEKDFTGYLRYLQPELRAKLPALIGPAKASRLAREIERPTFKIQFSGDAEMNVLGRVDLPSKTILISAPIYRELRLKSDRNVRDRASARVFESVLKKEILHLYLATVGVDDEYYQVSGKVFAP